jgi:threonine dehydrogenase-like Zn-dependent dehydrogenase
VECRAFLHIALAKATDAEMIIASDINENKLRGRKNSERIL